MVSYSKMHFLFFLSSLQLSEVKHGKLMSEASQIFSFSKLVFPDTSSFIFRSLPFREWSRETILQHLSERHFPRTSLVDI